MSARSFRPLAAVVSSWWAACAPIVLLLAFVWQKRVRDLELEIALQGGGPMWYTIKAAEPATFAKDFPGGTEQYRFTAPMYLYRFARSCFGLQPERLLPAFVAVEMAFMAVAMVVLLRTVRPQAPPGAAVVLVALVAASGARNVSLASLTLPFFRGLYHNVADGLCILGISAALRGRPVLAAVLLGGGFASHPALSVPAVVFAACPFLARPRELLRGRHLIAAAVFLVIVLGWVFGVLGLSSVEGRGFPAKLWFELTRFTCFHMYPVEDGVFTTRHAAVLVPFLSFSALAVHYLARRGPLGEVDCKVAQGMVGMFVLIGVGVLFSVVTVSVGLTKLALHRASAVVLSVGLPYVVAGLWEELGEGRWWRKLVAAILLASPFLGSVGYPLLFTLLLLAPGWRTLNRAAAALAAAAMLVVGVHACMGTAAPLTESGYTGFGWLSKSAVLVGLGVFALGLLVGRATGVSSGRVLAGLALVPCVVFWVSVDGLEPEDVPVARSYLAAQVWAREHTPREALFAVDPTIYYGWRDYSLRSSFGSVREWLYSSWLYNSDYRLCQEGLARLREFGLEASSYFGYGPGFAGFVALTQEVRRRYYGASDEWRLALARRYGISYFVFQKRPAFPGLPRTALPIAYQNAHFLVLSVPPRVVLRWFLNSSARSGAPS